MSLSIFLRIALVLTTLVPLSAQSGAGFPMVGIASGQSARINALNAAPAGDPSNPTSCNVTLQFMDANGKVLKQTTMSLQPGTAVTLDLGWDELSSDALRTELRAVLTYGYSGGANPPAGIVQRSTCGGLVPSLEVFDNTSGRTNFILTDAKPLPDPAVPAQ